MTALRYGSLFSGYLGLDMGVQSVLGGTTAWVSEIDKGACKILAHRAPDVPNLGDITTVDWSSVEPVDVLTGGFPCQDVSAAGKRAGIRPGTRSGLWSQFAYAISQLRPRLVVIENVRGLLSARAHSDVEPCAWCVGDDTDGALRALGAVLGDLASGTTRAGTAYALPTSEHHTDGSGSSSLLQTPVAAEGTKPSNTMGVARRLETGQVFLTNQIVSLCGLDPSEDSSPPLVPPTAPTEAPTSGARRAT